VGWGDKHTNRQTKAHRDRGRRRDTDVPIGREVTINRGSWDVPKKNRGIKKEKGGKADSLCRDKIVLAKAESRA